VAAGCGCLPMATESETSGSDTDGEGSESEVDDIDSSLLEERPTVLSAASCGLHAATNSSMRGRPCAAPSDTHDYLLNPPRDTASIRKSVYALPPASLTFRNLTFQLQQPNGKSKTILEPVSGHFEPGHLNALMGPSGSGKTTLLDMLAMKKTADYTGQVWVNGRLRNHRLFRRVSAYVSQEDIMPPHWTVKEAITFNAVLKQNPTRKHRTIEDWISVLIASFGLNEVEDSLIGGTEVRGISGGQRRRVTLARGVAAHASLLFADEPTSGLSATDAELCIQALKIICKRLHVTCVVVIHQPRAEVAEMFDTLVLLSSDPGRLVYFGPMANATAYWKDLGFPVPQNVNPTDYFMDTVTPGTRLNEVDAMLAGFRERQLPQLNKQVDDAIQTQGMSIEDMLTMSDLRRLETKGLKQGCGPRRPRLTPPQLRRHAIPFCGQFWVLLRRKITLTIRNPMAVALPLGVPVVQGLIIGYLFVGTGTKDIQRQVMFAFCLLTMLCLAGTMGLIVLITERTLMKHEASEALYSEGAWALAQQCVDIPLALLGAILNVAIMSFWAGLNPALLKTVGVWALLLFFVYDSLFAFIGAVAADTRQAQVLASPCVSVFMLFNGFIVTAKDAPPTLRWIFQISPNAYAMDAIVNAMLANAKADDFQATMFKQMVGFDEKAVESHAMKGFEVLGAMIVILRIGQMLGLKYLNHIKR